jgi:long-chain acyl-CoA synthetase
MNVYEGLTAAAADVPERAALEFRGQSTGYGALAEQSQRVAGGLRAQGVQAGDSVALMLPNVPAFAAALYGAWMNGSVVVPMNVLLTPPEIRYLLEDSRVRLVVVFELFLPNVVRAVENMASPPKIVVVGAESHGHVPYAEVAGADRAKPENLDDPHVLTIYTSGTTGKPKGAVIHAGNVIRQLDMTANVFEPRPDDRTLCVLPLFHVFALNALLNNSVRNRGTLVLHPKFELDDTVQSLENDGITVFAGVPTMYFYILKHPRAETAKFPALRHCISGGAALPVEVLTAFERRFGVPIYEGYGLTETTVSVCCNRPEARKPGSVGKPYDGVSLKIVDDAGAEVKAGELGEIVLRGPNLMRGYLNKPEATREAIRDGWFHTGDIGYVDEDGFCFIVDRKKDMIIKGGYNVYPREIEEVLFQLPEVAEAAVVGIQDPAKGELVRAVVAFKPGKVLDETRIRGHVAENLAKYKHPGEYVFVPELPKGPTGKILKRELRA